MATAGGKLKYIPKPLYRYNHNDDMMSLFKSYDDIVKYFEPYYINTRITIESLNINQATKSRYLAFMEIARYKMIYAHAFRDDLYDNSAKNELDERLLSILRAAFPQYGNWSKDLLCDYELFYTALKDNVYNISAFGPRADYDRVIAWGVFGIFSKAVLPYLKGTAIEPTVLWDIAGDGTDVQRPDVKSLTANDLVLVLPSQIYAKEIYTELAEYGCAMLSQEEIWTYLSSVKLPQFYDGSIRL